MTPNELDLAIKLCAPDTRFYQHLIAMKIVSVLGEVKAVADFLKVSPASVYKWINACEKGGLEALTLSFGGGRPCKLTDKKLIKLDKIILKTPNISMKDVHHIVKEEFDVEYSLKQMGELCQVLLSNNKMSGDTTYYDGENNLINLSLLRSST